MRSDELAVEESSVFCFELKKRYMFDLWCSMPLSTIFQLYGEKIYEKLKKT